MRSKSTEYSRNPQQKEILFIYFCVWLFRVGVTADWQMAANEADAKWC